MSTKRFIVHLLLLGLFVLLILFVTLQMMKVYTNHGQQLVLPDYVGQLISDAQDDAASKSFVILVNDSIYRLNTPGGQILSQNPKPNAKVKENRKVYVTVARHGVEKVMSDALPDLYGHSYEMRKKELAALDIDLVVKRYKYDIGAPNMILEAWYNGKQIDNSFGKRAGVEIAKGTSIEVILSENDNGETDLPDLRCNTLDMVKTRLGASRLDLGEVVAPGLEGVSLDQAYVYKQVPSPEIQSTIYFGSAVKVYLQKEKPDHCQ